MQRSHAVSSLALTMELGSTARLIFIAFFLKCSYGADDMSSLCPHIQKGFMDGMKSFQFDDEKGRFLADNGFTGKPTDVSFIIFNLIRRFL